MVEIMSEKKFSLFYVTAPDLKVAEEISRVLISEKIAACTNILPKMISFYMWKENLERSEEVVLLIKSFSDNKSKITARIQDLHPYEIPCVLELDIHSANKIYGEWMTSHLI